MGICRCRGIECQHTTLGGDCIFTKCVKHLNEEFYQQGRKDREEEIIRMILDIKLKAFLTIANTKEESLDTAYEVLGDTLDKLLKKIKEQKNETN